MLVTAGNKYPIIILFGNNKGGSKLSILAVDPLGATISDNFLKYLCKQFRNIV